LYYLGATQGLKAAFAGAVERRFIGALQDGKDAVEYHQQTVKLDPAFHDARLSIGMYDYIVGGLPGPVRLLVNVFGRGGSKKRGVATLEQVAREGRWAQDDARVMLIPIYKRERRFDDAARAARELAEKYPRNHLFKLEAADALVSRAAELRKTDAAAAQRIETEAFAVFESLLKDRGAAARQHDQIHFQYADALFVAGQTERAAREFMASASVANADPALSTLARLRAAQSFDLAGKRADALSQYKAVLARPDVYKAHDAARRGLKEPFTGTQLKQRADAGAEDSAETSKRGNEQ
jgi:tetratricopeptide (TPR) repeat protein